MKKNLLSFLTMVFLALGFAKAQNPSNDCKLKSDFASKPDNCTVSYTDKSSVAAGGTITNWFWSFGDGTSDTTKNPVHVYKKSGHYEVCLTVVGTNASGKKCKDISCSKVEVKNCGSNNDSTKCRLKAEFKSKVDSCTVTFADASKGDNGTIITGWNWSFGDGTTSTTQNPSHVYAHNGHYNVCLTVVGKNAAGIECKDIQCHSVIVKGCGNVIDSLSCKLAAIFKSKTDSCTVAFTDASVAGLGTTITKWYWSFGDGSVDSVQKNPIHTYAYDGHYSVCLTIVGKNALSGKECKDKECHFVDIKGCAKDTTICKLNAKFDAKTDSCTVVFTNSSTAAAGNTITKWYWSFGDGTIDSVQKNPTHVYAHDGQYNVCLTIVGKNSVTGKECKDKECHTVNVKGCAPDSSKCRLNSKFDAKVDSCTVTFADKSTTQNGGKITAWYWSFGDGTVDSVQNPTHVYKKSGHYSVCLTIEGVSATGQKCKDKECRSVMVKGCGNVIDSVKCKLAAMFKTKTDSCTVTFTDASSTGLGTTITKWYWNFGDGTVDSVQNPKPHVYKHDGNYTVCLTVVGKNPVSGKECKDKECRNIYIKGCAPDSSKCRLNPKFEYKIDSCTVSFSDKSTTGPGTTITNWYWSFGDGSVDSVQNPKHVYAHDGHYNVCLVIVGKNAITGKICKERECRFISVKGCAIDSSKCKIEAKFDYTKDSTKITFNDQSVTNTGTVIKKWYWSFGDGSVDSVENPVHVYAKPGKYKVCLVVVGVSLSGKECKDMTCRTIGAGQKEGLVEEGIAGISLLQLFPNPATDIVTIQFKVDVPGQVNISVSDIQGRVLSVVQDAYMTTGYHNVAWNVDVNAGLYFVTIKTGAGIEQKQLLIQQH